MVRAKQFANGSTVVEATIEASQRLAEFRAEADREWSATDSESEKAVWARLAENARRLALNYACSANYEHPLITTESVNWACDFARHQAERLLFMVAAHVAENEFDAKCNLFADVLRRWRQSCGQDWMPAWQVRRRLKGWTPRELDEVTTTLLARDSIERESIRHDGAGRPGEAFRLR